MDRYYRCVQEHLETWLAQRRDGPDEDGSVPQYIERELTPRGDTRPPHSLVSPVATTSDNLIA